MKPQNSLAIAACAMNISNAKHVNVNASTANNGALPINLNLRNNARKVDGGAFINTRAHHNPAFLIRGGSQEEKGQEGHSTSTSKRKKKKKSKSKKDGNNTSASTSDDNNTSRSSSDSKTSSSDLKSKTSVPVEKQKEEPINGEADSKTKVKEPSYAKPSETEPRPKTHKSQPKPNNPSTNQTPSPTTQQSQSQSQSQSQQQSNEELIEKLIKTTDLYEILSLDKSQKASLTSIQITKAYRRRAVLTHPDKLNGDRRAFDKVSEAYDILSDEGKKKIFDRYGLEAVKDPDFAARAAAASSGGGLGGSFQDQILRNFFRSSGSATMSQQLRKNKDLKYELEIALEDMYRGAHREIEISQPNGPKMVELDIPAGVVPGSSIRLSGMVDHVASATPGDVVFIVRQRKHETFTRKGHDLAMEVKISLSEAICGLQRQVVHLDGRRVNISGAVIKDDAEMPVMIQTGDVHVLKGEGMPKGRTSGAAWIGDDGHHDDVDERCKGHGDLYVQYVVEMPIVNERNADQLSKEERKTLGSLLDKLQGVDRSNSEINDSSKEGNIRFLRRATASDFGRASGTAEPYNDEDEHMREDEDDHYGRQGFQYFSSASGSKAQQFFSRGSSPFTSSSSFNGRDDGDVQCQQM